MNNGPPHDTSPPPATAGTSPAPTVAELGFGSAWLPPGREAISLLEAALDCGVTYFDTARMYGDGLAEGQIGSALGQARERITLASKAGILPPSRSPIVRALGKAVRAIHKAAPAAARIVPVPAAAQPRFGVFEPAAVRLSVEASLGALRTDRLDVLLLHECAAADVDDQLVEMLLALKTEGKVRALGTATSPEATAAIVRARPQIMDVVQLPAFAAPVRPAGRESRLVTHSALRGRVGRAADWLAAHTDLAGQLDVDPADRAAVARLLLGAAAQANPGGVVLFSSSSPETIRANVAFVRSLSAAGPSRALSEMLAAVA